MKNRGGLVKPNEHIVQLVKIADHILNEKLKTSMDIFSERCLTQKLNARALTIIGEQYPEVLRELETHSPLKTSHRSKVVKLVLSFYFALKIKHLCKLKNDHKNTFSRHLKHKAPIFLHE